MLNALSNKRIKQISIIYLLFAMSTLNISCLIAVVIVYMLTYSLCLAGHKNVDGFTVHVYSVSDCSIFEHNVALFLKSVDVVNGMTWWQLTQLPHATCHTTICIRLHAKLLHRQERKGHWQRKIEPKYISSLLIRTR